MSLAERFPESLRPSLFNFRVEDATTAAVCVYTPVVEGELIVYRLDPEVTCVDISDLDESASYRDSIASKLYLIVGACLYANVSMLPALVKKSVPSVADIEAVVG